MQKRAISIFLIMSLLLSVVAGAKDTSFDPTAPAPGSDDPVQLSDQLDKSVDDLRSTDAGIESARAEIERLNNLMQNVVAEPDDLTIDAAKVKYPEAFKAGGPTGAAIGLSDPLVSTADLNKVCGRSSAKFTGLAVADVPCSKGAKDDYNFDSLDECKAKCKGECQSARLSSVLKPEFKGTPDKTCWKCSGQKPAAVVNVNVCITIKITIIQNITIKINILLIKIKILIQKRINIYIRILNIKILIIKICFKSRTATNCPPPRTVERPNPTTRERIPSPMTTGPPPKESFVQAGGNTVPTETQCSCPEGTSTSKPDPNSILAQVQQYRCVSGASIGLKGSSKQGCPPCYGAPSININSAPPICKGTPCGDVACDGSASCPCPGKPNCTLTVRCTWGGWKMQGSQPVPILGASA